MTISQDERTERERKERHTKLMNKYLGDYDNQKGVIVSNLMIFIFFSGWLFMSSSRRSSRSKNRSANVTRIISIHNILLIRNVWSVKRQRR